jgi:hypothetical protein
VKTRQLAQGGVMNKFGLAIARAMVIPLAIAVSEVIAFVDGFRIRHYTKPDDWV